eukprot:NODE_10_length_61504_cov_0.956502.p8 type:complete len:544 gc:universal NODE_10_length_61504_cov_0.956502:47311-45680(-)
MIYWYIFWAALVILFTADMFVGSPEIANVEPAIFDSEDGIIPVRDPLIQNNLSEKNSDLREDPKDIAPPKIQPVEQVPVSTDIITNLIDHSFETFIECCIDGDFIKEGKSNNVYKHSMLLTAIDGLDTLILYHKTRNSEKSKHILLKVFDAVVKGNIIHDQSIGMFEMNIRVTGGLIGAYNLLNNPEFNDILSLPEIKENHYKLLEKAAEFVNKMMENYSNQNGVPYAFMNLVSGERSFQGWTKNALLSEVGSHQLEFKALDALIKQSKVIQQNLYPNYPFSVKSDEVFDRILKQSDHLYNAFIDSNSGLLMNQSEISIGAYGDSFYEYILKMFILTKNDFYKIKFHQVASEIEKNLLILHELKDEDVFLIRSTKSDEFDHLTCFVGGMFTLASQTFPDYKDKYLELGRKITHGCYYLYQTFPAKLGPDTCRPSSSKFECSVHDAEYKLRPELVESIFYLYRITGDIKYKEWNLEIANSIENNCKTDFGYASVNVITKKIGNTQDSWFVAETLKYLLLTVNPNLLPLSQFVLNTEAHPISIPK